MFVLKVDFNDRKVIANMKLIRNGLHTAARDTLNHIALLAAQEQKRTLPKLFTLRNKWAENTIWPKFGKKKGLVPKSVGRISRMSSFTGSSSQQMADQEYGFSKPNPSVPTKYARGNRKETKSVQKKSSLRTLRRKPAWKPSSLSRISDTKKRVSVIIAASLKENWDGLILIEDDKVLPAGYYRIIGGNLRMIRRNQKGSKRRLAKRWHSKAIKGSRLDHNAQRIYNKNARRILGGFL